jgi:alpha-beta hydrolase superfamily lysophospholipase
MRAGPPDEDERFSLAHDAHERIAAREAAERAVAWRSILMSHGKRTPRSYVLLHGLTASPAQFEVFGRRLYESGANVLIPRLPRHGHGDRLTDALAGLTVDELTGVVRAAVEIGAGLGERVTVVGFSLGGLMSAWVAQRLRVDRVVCIAPFFGVGWLPYALGPVLSRLVLRLPNGYLWWNPLQRERNGAEHTYPRFPTHAIGRTWLFARSVLAAAASVPPATRRIALVTNDSEATVHNGGVALLAAAWRRHPGVEVETHRLTGLRRSHDIIEPKRRRPLIDQVYPQLLRIVSEGD